MSETELIDINHADEADLANLPGIGPALAGRIVEYRETVHPFEEVIELAAVPGISERMVRVIADRLAINAVAGASGADTEPAAGDSEPNDNDTGMHPVMAPESRIRAAPSEEESPVTEPEATTDTEEEEVIETVVMTDNVTNDGVAAAAIEGAPAETEAASMSSPVIDATALEAAPPAMIPSADRDASPAAMAGEAMSMSQRRGCIFVMISTIFGALLGSALTLAVLAGVNGGTLTFAQANSRTQSDVRRVRSTQDELGDAVATLQVDRAVVLEDVAEMEALVDVAATQQAVALQTVAETSQQLETAVADIATLQEAAAALDARMTALAETAENFDLFLNGLQELLLAIQGSPIPQLDPDLTPAATVTNTATPASGSTTPAAAETAEPAETAVAPTSPAVTPPPTRTPRPTATPIIPSSPTPTRQPEP